MIIKTLKIAPCRTHDFISVELFCPWCGEINNNIFQTKSYFKTGLLINAEMLWYYPRKIISVAGECRDCHGFICVSDEAREFVEAVDREIEWKLKDAHPEPTEVEMGLVAGSGD